MVVRYNNYVTLRLYFIKIEIYNSEDKGVKMIWDSYDAVSSIPIRGNEIFK